VPLERIDLRRCTSVGEIVTAMSRSSFGARMLGEAASKIRRWIEEGEPIRVVYDGSELTPLLAEMRAKGWIRETVRADRADSPDRPLFKHLVLGRYSEGADAAVHRLDDAVFINKEELARPGQIRDGYFPDAVFAEPTYVLPVIFCALEEWLGGEKQTVGALFERLAAWPYGQSVVSGAETLREMVSDPDCAVFLTLSGAMRIAKMAFVICDMIDFGMVQAVSSTGALMAHGSFLPASISRATGPAALY
jgi:hypothetical protein